MAAQQPVDAPLGHQAEAEPLVQACGPAVGLDVEADRASAPPGRGEDGREHDGAGPPPAVLRQQGDVDDVDVLRAAREAEAAGGPAGDLDDEEDPVGVGGAILRLAEAELHPDEGLALSGRPGHLVQFLGAARGIDAEKQLSVLRGHAAEPDLSARPRCSCRPHGHGRGGKIPCRAMQKFKVR